MSLYSHLAVLAALIIDLTLGAALVDNLLGHYPAVGFEFLIILGYILFVLQWGLPWERRERGDSSDG